MTPPNWRAVALSNGICNETYKTRRRTMSPERAATMPLRPQARVRALKPRGPCAKTMRRDLPSCARCDWHEPRCPDCRAMVQM